MTAPDGPRFNYTPRRLSGLSRRRTWFVGLLKITLPLIALGIVGVLIARLSGGGQNQNLADIPKEEKTTPGQIELVKARYEGTDAQGRPYTVTADKAIRAMNAPDAVSFENPVADITLQDRTWVAVKAKGGTFDRVTETLELKDDVTVFHDSGYEMHVRDLRINLKDQTAQSTLPVEAQGPMGGVTAQNMSVEDQGNLVIFGGPAKMTIYKLTAGKERG